MPLHRAVTRVKLLPQTEAWAAAARKDGGVVQYALSLDHDVLRDGRCYWTVEARLRGATWRRFYVTPDGAGLLGEDGRPPGAERP